MLTWQRFLPPLQLMLLFFLCFWGASLVQAWWWGDLAHTRLPSSYDTGGSLMEQANTQATPLLVEFYSDTCLGCQQLTPLVHRWAKQPTVQGCLAFTMVNTDLPDNQFFTTLFGVNEVPALFVFDIKHMKRTPVALNPEKLPRREGALALAVKQAVNKHYESIAQPLPTACQVL